MAISWCRSTALTFTSRLKFRLDIAAVIGYSFLALQVRCLTLGSGANAQTSAPRTQQFLPDSLLPYSSSSTRRRVMFSALTFSHALRFGKRIPVPFQVLNTRQKLSGKDAKTQRCRKETLCRFFVPLAGRLCGRFAFFFLCFLPTKLSLLRCFCQQTGPWRKREQIQARQCKRFARWNWANQLSEN